MPFYLLPYSPKLNYKFQPSLYDLEFFMLKRDKDMLPIWFNVVSSGGNSDLNMNIYG
jgi:hypothetical protein